MQPLPARVVSPVSPCSFAVEVHGLLTRTSVQVVNNGKLVASGIAQGAIQTLSILPAEELAPETQVKAYQTLYGVRSPEPEGDACAVVLKQPRFPKPVGRLAWLTGIYECGWCVRLSGAYPGASVEIRDSVDITVGSGRVVGTTARHRI